MPLPKTDAARRLNPETVADIDRMIRRGPSEGEEDGGFALRVIEKIWNAIEEALG
jgi:hypothetical protein